MKEQRTYAQEEYQLNVEDLYSILQQVLLKEQDHVNAQEKFWVVGLAKDNRLLFVDWVDLCSTYSERERALSVFNLALQKGAAQIVFCRSHLENKLQISEEDRRITDQLLQLSQILDLNVVDYILFTDKEFISLRCTGILTELRQSSEYIPSRELVQHLQVEATKFTRRKVKEAKALATRIEKLRIAKALKYSGVDEDAIVLATGVTDQELERL